MYHEKEPLETLHCEFHCIASREYNIHFFPFTQVTNIHRNQWKVLLEHEETGYFWPFPASSSKSKDSGKGGLGSFPGARAKIQGFKQLSVEKFNNLRTKLTDSKSKTFSSAGKSVVLLIQKH